MGAESGDAGDGWMTLGLDPRLLRALTKKRYRAPTAVQSQAIPLVLEGKDVVARAHTGSGKTAAYLLPAIHKIVTSGDAAMGGAPPSNPRALVLVPTRELAHQVKKEAAFLLGKCAPSLRAGELPAAGCASAVLREFAGAPPEILIATPARAAECVRENLFPSGALASGLELLVLDEADLLLSFGYEEDIKKVVDACEKGVQCMLLSATAGEELARLESLVLQHPVRLDVSARPEILGGAGAGDDEKKDGGPDIAHRVLDVRAKDKLLTCMSLLRLGVCRRKTLVFVKDPDSAVRLRLFLDKFGVPCCALHAELPANSRAHILQEFNRGVYDYMIAAADGERGEEAGRTEDASSRGPTDDGVDANHDANHESDDDSDAEASKASRASRKKKSDESLSAPTRGGKKRRGDAEFGVARGVDFKDVRTVINFDVPPSASAYLHRVGRTGRAGKSGTAITLVSPAETPAFEAVKTALARDGGDAGAAAAAAMAPFSGLKAEAVESLRYRAEDAARSVGKTAVREARVRELRAELLNSERLAAHFEDNPEDLNLLKHDVSLAKQPPTPAPVAPARVPARPQEAGRRRRRGSLGRRRQEARRGEAGEGPNVRGRRGTLRVRGEEEAAEAGEGGGQARQGRSGGEEAAARRGYLQSWARTEEDGTLKVEVVRQMTSHTLREMVSRVAIVTYHHAVSR